MSNQQEWFPELTPRTISNEARDRLLDAVENPPPPNEALKAAMAERRKRLETELT